MRVLCGFIILFAAICGFECQVHYVPAQILIPTINGSLITNQTTSNNSVSYNNRPPYYVYPPTYYNNQPVFQNNSYVNNSVPYNGTKDGHLIVGNIQPYDRLLFNQEYFKPRRWWTYREKTVEYPRDLPAGYSRHETISALRVYNKFYDGNTATAKIVSGGIGRQYVKIELESNWGRGFKYLVQIFGR